MKKIFFAFLVLTIPFLLNSITQTTLVHAKEKPIDRKALVTRHNPSIDKVDILEPFTVGNGDFAFTADVTGLQTFYDEYSKGIPLGTLSNWGWHSLPNPQKYSFEQTIKYYNTYGRKVGYASEMNSDAAKYLRANPHRMHLGQIGFELNGKKINPDGIRGVDQSLNLWEGILVSNYTLENKLVHVETCSHPELNRIAVKINSFLIEDQKLSIAFNFPYASSSWGKDAADWNNDDKHESVIINRTKQSVTIERKLDSTKYFVTISWKGTAQLKQVDKHKFVLEPSNGKNFEFTWQSSPNKIKQNSSSVNKTFAASKKYWKEFWMSGGVIDLSQSKDPRAKELERRIVLSQYLTAVNCSGSVPPQETGLICNSWFGKFHLEMHWWHSAHFALWNRSQMLEKSLAWYKKILPVAEQNARRQGYDGARWSKMSDPQGNDSPSNVGVFLIWQQPHPIYYAELLYRTKKNSSLLNRYKKIVFETADFMASYAHWDDANKCYVLGPPLIPAQEIYKADSTMNPPFEISYWRFGLNVAQQWRVRLGLSRNSKWDDILNHLPKLAEENGFYKNTETAKNTFENLFNLNDHPAVLGAYGMLPYPDVDKEKMRATLKAVMKNWNWKTTWGWDFPLIAMTAARLGEPDIAIDALLLDVRKNTYLLNGHNYQEDRLPLYLPGNGGLLAAVAMMAAGWDDGPKMFAPGFPKDGNWIVGYEGINPLP